jgi:CRP/FNR family transcriptional regulator, cyclic AMP receptor protein
MRKVLLILTRLSDDDVDWIARVGERRRLPAGAVLIREGEPIDALTFVLDGLLSVTVAGVGEVASLGSGEILGEMSLVDESPPSATVTVVEPALVLSLNRTTLEAKIESDPHFAARLYRAIAMYLSVRMRGTVQRLGYGATRPASQQEIDMELMEKVHLAGARFDRILKKMMVA